MRSRTQSLLLTQARVASSSSKSWIFSSVSCSRTKPISFYATSTTTSSAQPSKKDNEVRLVLTAAGPDRVGITASLTQALVNHGGNLEAGRTTSLGGDYCIHLLLSLPAENENAFREEATQAIRSAPDWDLSIRHNTRRRPPTHMRARRIRLSGEDRPGIAHAVCDFYARMGINIQSMEIYSVSAAFSSMPLFKMDSLVEVPSRISDRQLE